MTLADAGLIFKSWERSPPTHVMVQIIASMFGLKPREQAPDEIDMAELMAIPGMAVQRGAAPAPVVDIEEMRERNRQRAAEMAKRAVA